VGRPTDPTQLERTLARATDYVLAHGLTGLSLRPLAAALDTSPRMLLYHFGSKEDLVAAVLAEARRRGAARLAENLPPMSVPPEKRLRGIWAWISAPERAPFVRLFFEVHAAGLAAPEDYPDRAATITDWFDPLGTAFRDIATGPDDTVTPSLVMAVIRGLLFDLTATGDRDRTDLALDRFCALTFSGDPALPPR
jgi:AcrR family transcriptional regulator